jgi:hypothetical protein
MHKSAREMFEIQKLKKKSICRNLAVKTNKFNADKIDVD